MPKFAIQAHFITNEVIGGVTQSDFIARVEDHENEATAQISLDVRIDEKIRCYDRRGFSASIITKGISQLTPEQVAYYFPDEQ